MLLKHGTMSAAATTRFLHDVVDMDHLSDKLKREFPDDASVLVEKVHVRGACVCTRAFEWRRDYPRIYPAIIGVSCVSVS